LRTWGYSFCSGTPLLKKKCTDLKAAYNKIIRFFFCTWIPHGLAPSMPSPYPSRTHRAFVPRPIPSLRFRSLLSLVPLCVSSRRTRRSMKARTSLVLVRRSSRTWMEPGAPHAKSNGTAGPTCRLPAPKRNGERG
jgi:hypothetical protein